MLETLILVGGLIHFGILLASAAVPRVLDWKKQLASLDELSRHIVWVHGVFIVLVIIAFGAIGVFNAPALASGAPLARWVCGFIAAFWGGRLAVQLLVFDARPYLRTSGLKIGYHGLTVVFIYLTVVFAVAAIGGSDGATERRSDEATKGKRKRRSSNGRQSTPHHSNIPIFHHSTTPSLHHSTLPSLTIKEPSHECHRRLPARALESVCGLADRRRVPEFHAGAPDELAAAA